MIKADPGAVGNVGLGKTIQFRDLVCAAKDAKYDT